MFIKQYYVYVSYKQLKSIFVIVENKSLQIFHLPKTWALVIFNVGDKFCGEIFTFFKTLKWNERKLYVQ